MLGDDKRMSTTPSRYPIRRQSDCNQHQFVSWKHGWVTALYYYIISMLEGCCKHAYKMSSSCYSSSKICGNSSRMGKDNSKHHKVFVLRDIGLILKAFYRNLIIYFMGQVQTDMGSAKNRSPPVTVQESANGIIDGAIKLPMEDSGAFISWQGNKLPY